MLPLEYDTQFARLRNHWGDRLYTSEFSKLLYANLRKIPDGVFPRMVDNFILYSAKPPLMAEFAESAARMARSTSRKLDTPRPPCKHCNSHGYFLVTSPVGHVATASCEHCVTGAELRSNPVFPLVSVSQAARAGYTRVRACNPAQSTDAPWSSIRAPGTPPSVECACEMIESGRSHHGAFKLALIHNKLSEAEMWQVYEAWRIGVVDPLALKRKNNVAKVLSPQVPEL